MFAGADRLKLRIDRRLWRFRKGLARFQASFDALPFRFFTHRLFHAPAPSP